MAKFGLKIYQDFDGYYVEPDVDDVAVRVFHVGNTREEATRNAITRCNTPIDYLSGDVDEGVAKEFNIPVRM